MTIQQVWQYGKERGSEFYSPYISDVDYIDNNHYIVHSGGIVRVDGKPSNQPAGLSDSDNIELLSDTVELINNQVVFEIKLPTNTYRVEKMNPYSDAKFKLGKAKQLGSLGETKPTEISQSLIFTSHQPDDNYSQYDIKLSQEDDRLVVQGQFKRGQEINIILRRGLSNRIYNLRVSKRPYTAMCVDLWSEDEVRDGIAVTKYINSSGLKGRYCIYIEIDGQIYNTGQYVKFD